MCKYISIEELTDYVENIRNTNSVSNVIKITKDIINKGYVYKSVVSINTLIINPSYICPIFDPNVFIQWINREEVFAINLKYMLNYIDSDLINNPILNYLTRYIHFGPYGIKGEPEIQGVYKLPFEYFN